MLIRWATESDLPAWYTLATEVSKIFQHPADMGAELGAKNSGFGTVGRYEMLTAVDYMSGNNMGFICFSRTENCISWFAVSERYRGKGAGSRLLKTALRQLDTGKDITVNTFPDDYPQGMAARAVYRKYGFTEERPFIHDGLPRCEMTRPASAEKRGGSFHYDYIKYAKCSQKEFCPCCNNYPMSEGSIDIAELEHSWATAEYPGQGRLFGKMHMTAKIHAVDFEEMPPNEMAGFMREVQKVGKALHKVTGTVKINYEMHANSGPHLHTHLFPRYLDDDFPRAPIDYRMTEPAPYESYDEYLWFIEQMRGELNQ